MIDNTIITKKQLSEKEVVSIVLANNLTQVYTNGKKSYNNYSTNNFQGFKINITPDNSIKVICSLHKYNNYLLNGTLINYNDFSIEAVYNTTTNLLQNIGLNDNNIHLNGYEIGINLKLARNCIEYLNYIESIGKLQHYRPFYINPKYKEERCKTTIFHKDKRKFYKVYDKCYEMADKGRKDIPNLNILRLETTYRRIEKTTLKEFLKKENLVKIQEQFFNDWESICFSRNIEAPKGTTNVKKNLCIEILSKGTSTVLKESNIKFNNGLITAKQLKYISVFINKEWQYFKHEIKQIKTVQEEQFRNEFERKKQLLII